MLHNAVHVRTVEKGKKNKDDDVQDIRSEVVNKDKCKLNKFLTIEEERCCQQHT